MVLRVLTERILDQILKLQQLFHSKYLTVDLLNELISSYVQVIQCFDGIQSPMRKYFLNKIQFIVSRPEINMMLERVNGKGVVQEIIRQTVRGTVGLGIQGLGDGFVKQQMMFEMIENDKKVKKDKENEKKIDKQKQHTNQCKNNKPITEKQKQQQEHQQQQKYCDRHLKIQMQMKVMRQIEQNMKNIQSQFNNQSIQNMKKNNRINALMEQQNNTLQNRLAMRRKNKKNKKSTDQKEIKERQEEEGIICKEDLKQAQKQIQQAVVRMTLRMTQRGMTGRGLTRLIQASEGQMKKGRVKVRNQVKQDDVDEENEKINLQKNLKKRQDSARQTNLMSGNGGKGRITIRKQTNIEEQDETF